MTCMVRRKACFRWWLFVICLAQTLVIILLLARTPLQENQKCQFKDDGFYPQHHQLQQPEDGMNRNKLALIVPFRDRFEELLQFVPHMQSFLNKQKVPHRIFIVNQVDKYRYGFIWFNRAALINVGYLESRGDCDYLAMHDVDLLPDNLNLNYSYPARGPFHVASPGLHPLYNYEKFVGGILLLTYKDFEKTKGLSNKYWGWGREDDEFYVRMKEAGLRIYRPENITTGRKSFIHIHDRKRRPRDVKRYFNQKKESGRRDRQTGFHTVKYKIKKHMLKIDDVPLALLNVNLYCDIEKTPWCLKAEDHGEVLKLKQSNMNKILR